MIYGSFGVFRRFCVAKNKANLFRIEYCVMRIAKSNLKKQTQFPKGQNAVKSILIMVYGDFDGPRLRKNKPNSKPNLFSPQMLWGLKNRFEKTKPICGVANECKLFYI